MYTLLEKKGEPEHNFIGSMFLEVQDATIQDVMNCFMFIHSDVVENGLTYGEYVFQNEEGDQLVFSDYLSAEDKEEEDLDLSFVKIVQIKKEEEVELLSSEEVESPLNLASV